MRTVWLHCGEVPKPFTYRESIITPHKVGRGGFTKMPQLSDTMGDRKGLFSFWMGSAAPGAVLQ